MKEILLINDLTYNQYHNFNLKINSEKFVSIIGSNMSGKTTLFKLITGIIPTYDVVICNEISLNPRDVNKYIRQLGVVMPIKSESFLFETVNEEMRYPLENLGYSNLYIERRINKVLNLFSLDIKDKKISELDCYEKQILLFCISLLHKPKVLLIDDVFSFINKDLSIKIISVLKKIKNLTVINFSSNLNYLNYSDYVYVIDDGNIILEGLPDDILKEDAILKKIGIEIPFVVNLSNKLKDMNLSNKNYDNLEVLVNEVWK